MTRLEELKARRAQLQAQMAPPEAGAVNAAPADTSGMSRLEQLKARRDELRGQQPKEAEAWYEDFGEGLMVSGQDLYYGAKDLVSELDDEDRATMADWKADAAESGWGTAGQVTGELAQFMIPGGLALKGLKGVNALKNASKLPKLAALMGTEGATAAAVGATRLPDEGETRGGNALQEGTLGAVGAGVAPLVGRALSKTMRGAAKTDDAIKMLDEGIDLTPGMMAKSPGIQGLETVMEVTPFAAQGTKIFKQAAADQWNLKTLKDAMPAGFVDDVTEIGDAGIDQMRAGMKQAYDDAWKGSGRLRREDVTKVMNSMRRNTPKMKKSDERVMQAAWDDIEKLIADRSTNGFQAADDMLRSRIKSAGVGKYDLSKSLNKARKALRSALDPEALAKLKKVDAKYPDYLSAKAAGEDASKTGGVFTPDQYTMAVKKVGKGNRKKALRQAATAARNTVGKKEGGQPLDFFRRIAGALPSWEGGMKVAGRTLMGQTAPQKFVMKGVNNPRVQALRELTSSGGASAALYGDE